MSARAALPEEADRNQARASDPSASAWVSANAGTGKTEVLVKRVQRLLLAGFRPESILCLTYTKTAAAEMQNRLLKDLAALGDHVDDELRDELEALMRRAPETRRSAQGAAPVRPRARSQRRAQDPHHPRLLRAAVAALPARGAGDAAFLGARRARAGAAAQGRRSMPCSRAPPRTATARLGKRSRASSRSRANSLSARSSTPYLPSAPRWSA